MKVNQRRTSPRLKKVTFALEDELLDKPHQAKRSAVNLNPILKKEKPPCVKLEVLRAKRESACKDEYTPNPKRNCLQSAPTNQNTQKFPSLYTRMSPNSLFFVIQRLDYPHYRALEEIGFSGLFWLRVNQLPLQLGYWLVDNFDPYRNCIILPTGDKLQITPEDVHATFGLPMGPKKVELARSFNESEEFIALYAKWKSQFDVNENQISVKTLMSHLVDQSVANDEFKVNFVLLVVSLLIRNTQKSFVNVYALKSLGNANDICNYDWCEFVLSCLRAAKLDWMKNKVNFCGPLLFLVLVYVDRIVRGHRSVERDFYTLSSWTTTLLNAREKEEIQAGRFGDGYLVSPMQERVDDSSTLLSSPSPQPVHMVVPLKRSPAFYSSPQEYKQDYMNASTQVARAMVQLEEIVEVGERCFPNDQTVSRLHSSTELLYKTYGGTSTEDDQNMLIDNLEEENDMVEYFDALMIALNKKRAIQKLHDRFAAFQRGELVSRHTSLLSRAFEGLKLNKDSVMEEVVKEVTQVEVEKGANEVEVEKEVCEAEVEKVVCEDEVEKELGEDEVEKELGEDEVEKELGEDEVEKEVSAKEDVEDFGDRNFGVTRVDDSGAKIGLMEEGTGLMDEGVGMDIVNDDNYKVQYKRLRKRTAVGVESKRKSPRFQEAYNQSVSADVVDQKSGTRINKVAGKDSGGIVGDPRNGSSVFVTPSVRFVMRHRFPRKRTDGGLKPFYPPAIVLKNDTSPTKPLTTLHEAIVDYIYSVDMKSKALAKEGVFLVNGVEGTRLDFSNFKPPCHLNDTIIDCWSCYLNYKEKEKDSKSPNRFFSGTLAYLLGTREGIKSKDEGTEYTYEERIKSFQQVLNNEFKRFDWLKPESIDMFFFPIIRDDHIYLFVFDLSKKRFHILDNFNSRGSVQELYGDHPMYMSDNLSYFLGERGLGQKSRLVSNMNPVIANMGWRNSTNVDDCGIYTMRHMETYKGDIRGWTCGLSKNNMEPLKVLRMKYLCTLIGFEENQYHDAVMSDAKTQWLCNRDRFFKY